MIHEGGSVTYGGGDASTYSGSGYYAINKAGDFGDTVSAIRTEGSVTNAGTSIATTGVCGIDNGAATLTISSMPGGIAITNDGWIGAINQQSTTSTSGTSTLDVQGVGDISVKATGSYDKNGRQMYYAAKGIGIYEAKNSDITQNKVTVGAKSLTVECEGDAHAIQGKFGGRTIKIDVEDGVSVRSVVGTAYGSNLPLAAGCPDGHADLSFGSLTVSSEGKSAYGLHCVGGATADVVLNGNLSVSAPQDTAVGLRLAGNSDWSLKGKDGKAIDIILSGAKGLGGQFGGTSSTAKLSLDVNTFAVTGTTTTAHGLYMSAGTPSVTGSIRTFTVSAQGDATAIAVPCGNVGLAVGALSAVSTEGAAKAILADGGQVSIGGIAGQPVSIVGDVEVVASGSTLTFTNAVDLVGNVTNAGTIALGSASARPFLAVTGAFNNTGTVTVDMTGATAAKYTLIAATEASDFGTCQFAVGKDNGYRLRTEGNDLVAVVGSALLITDQTSLTAAADALTSDPAIWYIANDFTVSKRTLLEKKGMNVTIFGNGHTITGSKVGDVSDDSTYVLGFNAVWEADANVTVDKLNVVVGNGFRNGVQSQWAKTNGHKDHTVDCTLTDVNVTMARTEPPMKGSSVKTGAALVDNDSFVTLKGSCSFTADEWTYSAIDITAKDYCAGNFDATLTVDSAATVTFVDGRTNTVVAVEPLVKLTDEAEGSRTAKAENMDLTALTEVSIEKGNGYSYVVALTPETVGNTSYGIYAGEKDLSFNVACNVPSNGAPVVVVYFANAGYCFADGSLLKTNEVDTTTNPAAVTGTVPAAPISCDILDTNKLWTALAEAGVVKGDVSEIAIGKKTLAPAGSLDEAFTNVNAGTVNEDAIKAYAVTNVANCVYTNLYIASEGDIAIYAELPEAEESVKFTGKWTDGETEFEPGATILITNKVWKQIKQYTVTYDVFEYRNETSPAATNVYYGTQALEPVNPTSNVDKVEFGGWYTKPSCDESSKYDFATRVTADLTLYAKWWNSESGSFLPPALNEPTWIDAAEPRKGFDASWTNASGAVKYRVTVKYNKTATGYQPWSWGEWADWKVYEDQESLVRSVDVSESDPGTYTYIVQGLDANGQPTDKGLSSNIVVRVPAKVEFYSPMKGAGQTNQFVNIGECAACQNLTNITVGAKTYAFKGWFEDTTCTVEYDFATPITGDTKIYALWKEVRLVPTAPDYDNIPQESIVYEPKLLLDEETKIQHYIPYTNYPTIWGEDPKIPIDPGNPGAGIRVTPMGWYHGNEKNANPYFGPQDVFLGNQYIELGLHRNGAFGTKNAPPGNFHVWTDRIFTMGLRASMTGWESPEDEVVYLYEPTNKQGMVCWDFRQDVFGGFGIVEFKDPQGTVTRDFFTPGSIDEGWLVTVGDGQGNPSDYVRGQYGSYTDFRGLNLSNSTYTVKVYKQDGLPAEGETNHTIAAQTVVTTTPETGLKITQVVQFSKFDTGYDTWVTISNASEKTMNSLSYYRAFDPDHPGKCYSGSKYKTDNFYYNDPETQDAYVIVSAVNSYLSATTTFKEFVERTVTPFIFWAPNPKEDPTITHKYTITPMTQRTGWTTVSQFKSVANGYHRFYDTGMSIRFDLGDVQPGEAVRIYYYSSLDPWAARAFRKMTARGSSAFAQSAPPPSFDPEHENYGKIEDGVVLYNESYADPLPIGFQVEGAVKVDDKYGAVYFTSNLCDTVAQLLDPANKFAEPCEITTVDDSSGTPVGKVVANLPLIEGEYHAYYVTAGNVLSPAFDFFMTKCDPIAITYHPGLDAHGGEWFDFTGVPGAETWPTDLFVTNTYMRKLVKEHEINGKPVSSYVRSPDTEAGFSAWYHDVDGEMVKYTFGDRLSAKLDLYAGWKKKSGLALIEENTNDVSVAESGSGWEYTAAGQLKIDSSKVDTPYLTVTNTPASDGSVGAGTKSTSIVVIDGEKLVLSGVTVSNVTALVIGADKESAADQTNRVVFLNGISQFSPSDGTSAITKYDYAKGSLTLRSLAGTNSAAAYGQGVLLVLPKDRTPVVDSSVGLGNLLIQGGTYNSDMPTNFVDVAGGYWCFGNGNSTWTAWPFADVTFKLNNGSDATYTTVRNRRLFTVDKPADPTLPLGGAVTNAFIGWYKDKGCTQPWDFANDTVVCATNLYAHWVPAGAIIIDEDGNPKPMENIKKAIEEVPNGGTVLTPAEEPAGAPVEVDKPVVIVIGNDPTFTPPSGWYVPGPGLVATNSGNLFLVGESVSNFVYVAQDVKPAVEDGAKPHEVADTDWAYLTNSIATEVQQKVALTNELGVCTDTADMCAALTDEIKSNLVALAASAVPGAEAVRVTVNLAVTPKDIRINQESTEQADKEYIKYAFDVKPVAWVEALKGGMAEIVTNNLPIEAESAFVAGTVFRVVLSAKGMHYVNKVVHILGNGESVEYSLGVAPTLSTFTWDRVTGEVVILATENSEFQIWASDTDGEVIVELKAGPELGLGGDDPGFIVTNVGLAVSLVNNTEIKVSTGYQYLPTVESMYREGYEFDAWYFTNGVPAVVADAWGHTSYELTDLGNHKKNGETFAFGELDHTLYARWVKAPCVTYDAQGGKFADGRETISKFEFHWAGYQTTNAWVFVNVDNTNGTYTVKTWENPTKEGYTFLGWYDGWTNGAVRIDQDDPIRHVTNVVEGTGTKMSADHTLYARWQSNAVAAEEAASFWEARLATAEREPVDPVHDQKGVTLTGPKDSGAVPLPADVIFPERIGDVTNGAPVLAIGKKSFQYDSYDSLVGVSNALRSVSIPTYAKNIEAYAFRGASQLTNVVFSQTHDYATGEKSPLYIGANAFAGTDVRTLVFPAGLTVNLGSGCFEGCTNLTSVYFFGDVASVSAGPFRKSGNPSTPFTIYLSPTMAANAALVQKLTNAMNSASIELATEPLGTVKILSGPISWVGTMTPQIAFVFEADITSPWGAVNEKTVRLFYTDDPGELKNFVGTGKWKPANEVTPGDLPNRYQATFDKPEDVGTTAPVSQFYRLTVGAER